MADPYVNPYTGSSIPYNNVVPQAPMDPFNSWTVQSDWSLPTGDPVGPPAAGSEGVVPTADVAQQAPAPEDQNASPETTFTDAVDAG